MTSPLITIIIPVYNTEKYLEQCLESCIAQTYSNIEILCVYDVNTTDKSLEILKKYKNIKIIEADVLSLGASRNVGVQYAKGEFISFLDSDDWLDPSFIEATYSEIKTNEYDLVICSSMCFNNKKLEFYVDDFFSHKSFVNNEYKKEDLLLLENIVNLDVNAYNKLYKSNIIKDNNIKFLEKSLFEDNNFYFHYILKCTKKVKFLAAFLHFYRTNRDGSLVTKNNKFIDMFQVMVALKNIFTREGVLEKYKLSLNQYTNNSILYWGMGNSNNKPCLEYCKKMSEWLKDGKINLGKKFSRCIGKPKKLQRYLYRKKVIIPLIKKYVKLPFINTFIIKPLEYIIGLFNLIVRLCLMLYRLVVLIFFY